MRFAGRLVEDFKLLTGTWVRTGATRIAAITNCAPLVRDAVVCGHDREFIGVLAWPDEKACRALDPALAALPLADLVCHPRVVAALAERLALAPAAGTSEDIKRAMLMAEPPSIDANEIADKGYVNQAATRARRAALVEALYQDPPPAHVACAGQTPN
jgi:feruloyl-CoA synthase